MPRPSRPAPAGISASLAVKRSWGKPAVASGGGSALRVCPVLHPFAWGAPGDLRAVEVSPTFCCDFSIHSSWEIVARAVVPTLLHASWMVPLTTRESRWRGQLLLLVVIIGTRYSASSPECLRWGAAGAVPMLPRQWPVGEGRSDQGLELWRAPTFPGVPLMFKLRCLYRAELSIHGVVAR